MRIQISKIEPVSEHRRSFEIQLDEDVVVGHITEFEDGEIQGFNFDEEFFDVLFAFNGLGRRFNRDYWAYRKGESQPFPWNYGVHDRDIVDRAIKESKTELASLR